MNISRINLNLLVALDALLTESNVSRAAHKVCITQSAMSNILKQLRALFQDDLLVKNGRKMILTLRAEALRPEIKQFLAHAECILQNNPFDPCTSTRLFVIGMEEYAAIILLPALYAYLSQHAPHIKINIKNIPLFAEKTMLEEKEIELAIGSIHPTAAKVTFPHDVLLQEKLVCIGKPNHPLFKQKISLNKYLSAKHISFMPISNLVPHVVDQILEEKGYERDVALRVSHIMPAIYTLECTDLIATVPESIANEVSNILHFSVQDCALPLPKSKLAQMWHPWSQADNGCVWLRNVIKEIAYGIEKNQKK
jgi:DNA-binding transcriptional LysR family regulator